MSTLLHGANREQRTKVSFERKTVELFRLVFVAAWWRAWDLAGAYGLRGAAIIGASASLIMTVLAEKYFGQRERAVARKIIVGVSGLIAGPLLIFCALLLISLFTAPSQVLRNVRDQARQEQRQKDERELIPKPQPRRLGYAEAYYLIPFMLNLPRPCSFRVIAAPDNVQLRSDFVTLTTISTRDIPGCVLMDDSIDSEPIRYEDQPDCPRGTVTVRAKKSWLAHQDALVVQFRMLGFQRVAHGKDLPETGHADFMVIFGRGLLW